MSKSPKNHLVRSVISGKEIQTSTSTSKSPPSTKNVHSRNNKKRGERRGQSKPRR
jgi:hypothetical protein